MPDIDLKPLLNGLGLGLAKEDLADINKFLKEEVMVSQRLNSTQALTEASEIVGGFIQLRVRHWLRLMRGADEAVSGDDLTLAIKQATNVGVREDRMLSLANKLGRALEKVGRR